MRDATEPEDIELLSDILNYMLREPWATNIDAGWFIYYLESKKSRDIDAVRAVKVINRLHEKNRYSAAVLCQTLSGFVSVDESQLVIDQLLAVGQFSPEVIDTIKGLHLNPPMKGERKVIAYPPLFLSYSRADSSLMRKIRDALSAEGFKVWTDEMLEPGSPEWQRAIEQAIIDAGAVVVALTPAVCESEWVRREISYAQLQKKRIFPILAAGDETSVVPIALVSVQRGDVREKFGAGISELGSAIRGYLVEHDCSRNAQNS